MIKKELSKKLNLRKETITSLDVDRMENVKGGVVQKYQAFATRIVNECGFTAAEFRTCRCDNLVY